MDKEKNRLNPLRMSTAICSSLFLFGCSAPKHHDAIFFTTNTQVGLKVGADSFQRPTIEVGYNRQEGAVVPLYIANSEKFVSSNDPFVKGLLEKASEKLGDNSDTSDQVASDLVNAALELYQGENQAVQSPILETIKREVDGLSRLASAEKPQKRILIQQMIEVERNKSLLISQFNENAKYIAEQSDSGKRDAYSVFGTFSGDTGAKASVAANEAGVTTPNENASASFSGNIAQSFATGVAAQIWADQGAGIAGGPPKELSSAYVKGFNEFEEQKKVVTKIVGEIFPGGTKSQAKETAYRNLISPQNPGVSTLDPIFASATSLENHLLRAFSLDQLKHHYEKLK